MSLISISYIVAIALGLCTLIGAGVRYTIRFVVWISRWLVLMEVIAVQFRPNHGSSIVDRLETVEAAILEIRASLKGDELAPRRQQGPA